MIGVTDGDTIKVLVDKATATVRLEGIDAPESGQSFGTKARQALAELVAGKTVTVKKTGTDKYSRTLGFVVANDVDVNAKMIEDGWAWHFVKYNDEERLQELEVAARKAKRGLWADNNVLAPWDYRARQSQPQETPKATQTAEPKAEGPTKEYWLNTPSNVRHNQRCQYFKNTKKGRLCGPTDGKACDVFGV